MSLVLSVAATKPRGPGASDLQSTPRALFDRLHAEFDFALDAAAEDDPEFHRCDTYFTPRDDGLKQSWADALPSRPGASVWCNPPYSNVAPWIEKAGREARENGVTSVLLVMAATSLGWFRTAMQTADEIRLIVGSLTFGPSNTNRAPFGSALIVFRAQQRTPGHAFITWIDRDEKNLACDVCDETFARERQLSGHRRSAHNIRKKKLGRLCNNCADTFTTGAVCDECDFGLCKACCIEAGEQGETHIHAVRKY
jgi:phage N-6-adenine-methyltransferase